MCSMEEYAAMNSDYILRIFASDLLIFREYMKECSTTDFLEIYSKLRSIFDEFEQCIPKYLKKSEDENVEKWRNDVCQKIWKKLCPEDFEDTRKVDPEQIIYKMFGITKMEGKTNG